MRRLDAARRRPIDEVAVAELAKSGVAPREDGALFGDREIVQLRRGDGANPLPPQLPADRRRRQQLHVVLLAVLQRVGARPPACSQLQV